MQVTNCLQAEWKPNEYILTYELELIGEKPIKQKTTHDVKAYIISDTYEREGYIFGWGKTRFKTKPDYVPGEGFYPHESFSIFPIWERIKFTLTYDANGGKKAPNEQTIETDKMTHLSDIIPDRKGYVFLGWSENKSPWSAVFQPKGEFTARRDVTLYAMWEEDVGENYVNKVTISTKSINLQLNEQRKLTAIVYPINTENKKISWVSSNPDVATVTDGIIKAYKKGNTVITAYAGNYYDSCKVNVEYDEQDDINPPVYWVPEGVRIYLSPENQTKYSNVTRYFYGTEREQMEELSYQIHSYLMYERHCNVKIGDLTIGDNNNSDPKKRVDESNARNYDYHICIHSNATKGAVPGPEVHYYYKDDIAMELAQSVYTHLYSLYELSFPNAKMRGIKENSIKDSYMELRETSAISIYIETAFHDNEKDARWIIEKRAEIAKSIGDGIYWYLYKKIEGIS